MRGKEEALDYRYFPEPDLPALVLDDEIVEAERCRLPELPDALEDRLADTHGLPLEDVLYLSATPARVGYFDAAAADLSGEAVGYVAKLMRGEIAAALNRAARDVLEADLLSPEALARIAELRADDVLSAPTAARAIELVITGEGGDVDEIVGRHDLAQVRDASTLDAWVNEVLEGHPDEAGRLRSGEDKLIGFFMGELMKASRGQADPGQARALLARIARGGEGE